MNVIEILITGLVFMALFPTLMTTFLTPTTNTTVIPALYMTIFSIVPLLIVVGLLAYVWSKSQGGKGAGIKI